MVAGKGGVGKTTVSMALALLALEHGLRPLLVTVERSGIDPGRLLPEGVFRSVTPDGALAEYLADHGLGRVSKRLAASGAIDVIATAAPGIRDLLVLGKVKQLERAGDHDLVVVDAPAAGHALSFLAAPATLHDLVRSGPVRSQADDVLELLADPRRCSVLLLTHPEETSVNEVAETAFYLEDRVGVKLGPVVVNGVQRADEALAIPPAQAAAASGRRLSASDRDRLAAAAAITLATAGRHARQLDRLGDLLPLPQLVLPRVGAGLEHLSPVEPLAAALGSALEGLAPPGRPAATRPG
jgi:anion-transporting  ArsA/GET3 family ATPase